MTRWLKSVLSLIFVVSCLLFPLVSALATEGNPEAASVDSGKINGPTQAPTGKDTPVKDLPQINLPRTLSEMSKSVSEYYLPLFVNELERPLIPYVKVIAGVFICVLTLFTLVQLGRESQGQAVDIAYQGVRFVACYILIIWGPGLVTNLFDLGYWLTNGTGEEITSTFDGQVVPGQVGDNLRGGYLGQMRARWRNDFNNNYQKFQELGLFMKVGNDIQFEPAPGETRIEEVIPFMEDPKDGNFVRQFFSRLDPSTWTPTELFNMLTLSRGVMEVGLLSTKILLLFLIPALRILAPIFACLAVNKSLSASIAMNYVKGVIVATLIFPIVITVLEIAAYMIGNMAFGAFVGNWADTRLVHTWNPEQMQVITQGNPTYVALMGSVLMAISGLCIVISPFIAYRLTTGDAFAAVTSAVAGWTGSMISAGVQTVSAAAGAAFGRQADSAQNVGQFKAANVSALAQRNAENARAAGQLSGAKAEHTYNINAANTHANAEKKYNQGEADYGRFDSTRSFIPSTLDSLIDFGGRFVGVPNAAERVRQGDRDIGRGERPLAPTAGGAMTQSVQQINHTQNQANLKTDADRSEKVTNADGRLRNAEQTAAGAFAGAEIGYQGALTSNAITLRANETASQLREIGRVVEEAGAAAGRAVGDQMTSVNRF